MSAIELKNELRQMIDSERDVKVLEAIKTLLQATQLNPKLKEKLTERALKSEKDISEGRLLTKDEVILRTQIK